MLRIDGPLYTANVRSANRRILAAVDARPTPDTLVVDMLGRRPCCRSRSLDEFADLERELAARGVTLWIAALPPHALALARRLPRWDEFESEGRLFPTALAAVRAYRSRQHLDARGSPRTWFFGTSSRIWAGAWIL